MLNRLRRVKLHHLASAVIAALERLPGENPETWMLLCEKDPQPLECPAPGADGAGTIVSGPEPQAMSVAVTR